MVAGTAAEADAEEVVGTAEGAGAVVYAVAVFADGKRVVSGSGDNTVKIWDAESGEQLRTLSGHRNGVKEARGS